MDAADAAGPTTTDGCSPFTKPPVTGNFALRRPRPLWLRDKVQNAKTAGAIGIVVGNNNAGSADGHGRR